MKKLKFVSWIFLACFRVFVPMEVSGQSMVLIERDTFRMYSNPLNADSTVGDQGVRSGVFSSLYSGCVSVLWVVALAGGFLIFGEDRRYLWHDAF